MKSYAVTFSRTLREERGNLGDQTLVVQAVNDVVAMYDAIDIVERWENVGIEYLVTSVQVFA